MTGLYQYIIVMVLTFAISFIMGMSVVNVVSQKMSDISINVPKPPPAKIIIDGNLPWGPLSPTAPYQVSKAGKGVSINTVGRGEMRPPQQKGGGTVGTIPSKAIKKPERSIKNPKPKERYYLDPKEMNESQLDRFVRHAEFRRMTLKDYTSWLDVQKSNPSALAEQHKNNLIKVMNGQTLSLGDLPNNMFNQRIAPTLNLSPWNSLTDVQPRGIRRHLRKVQLFNSDIQKEILNKVRPKLVQWETKQLT